MQKMAGLSFSFRSSAGFSRPRRVGPKKYHDSLPPPPHPVPSSPLFRSAAIPSRPPTAPPNSVSSAAAQSFCSAGCASGGTKKLPFRLLVTENESFFYSIGEQFEFDLYPFIK